MIQIKEKRKFNDLVDFIIEGDHINFGIYFNDRNCINLVLPLDLLNNDDVTYINEFGIVDKNIIKDDSN